MLRFIFPIVLLSLISQYSSSVYGNVAEQRGQHNTHAPHTHPGDHHHTTHSVIHGDHHNNHTTQSDILFRYDTHSMIMMASQADTCYLYLLKIDESHLMNHVEGLKQIENNVISMIQNNNSTLVEVEFEEINREFHGLDHRHCDASAKYYIIK